MLQTGLIRVRVLSEYPGYSITDQGIVFGPRGKVLRPDVTWQNRERVTLYVKGKQVHKSVHQLVALAYLGDAPSDQHEVAHINGDRRDNRASNLAWKTRRENDSDKDIHGTRPRGVSHGQAKLSEEDVLDIRARYNRTSYHNSNWQELTEQYGISRNTLERVVSRKLWAHLP